jgi:hypothetical protein
VKEHGERDESDGNEATQDREDILVGHVERGDAYFLSETALASFSSFVDDGLEESTYGETVFATICTVTLGEIFTLAMRSSISTSSPMSPAFVITRSPFFRAERACDSFFCRRFISKKKGTKMTSIIKMGVIPARGEDGAWPPPAALAGGVESCATPGVPALGWTFCASNSSLDRREGGKGTAGWG